MTKEKLLSKQVFAHPEFYYNMAANAAAAGDKVSFREHFYNPLEKYRRDNFSGSEEEKRRGDKFVGDCFEVWVEGLLKFFHRHPRVALNNYVPADPEDDVGVDGYGKDINGEDVACNIKYRANPSGTLSLIEYGALTNTWVDAEKNYGFNMNRENSMRLITNSYGMTSVLERELGDHILFIGGKEIEDLVNKNPQFWMFYYNLIKEALGQ